MKNEWVLECRLIPTIISLYPERTSPAHFTRSSQRELEHAGHVRFAMTYYPRHLFGQLQRGTHGTATTFLIKDERTLFDLQMCVLLSPRKGKQRADQLFSLINSLSL